MAKLSEDKKSVTVVKGDTLWGIAETYGSYISGSTTQAKINTMVSLNHINNPNYIVEHQVIKLSGSASAAPTNKTYRAKISVFGLQSNTDRTIYATWIWTKSNTKEYKYIWYYDTGDGVWFIGSDSTTTDKQSIYNAPSNAKRVKFKVKPISKTKKVDNVDTNHWTASWSTTQTYNFSSNPPIKPSVPPTVNISNYKLTATLDNIGELNATDIQFEIVRDDIKRFAKETVSITKAHASYECTVTAGSVYKVRCRSHKNKVYSDWTEYSANTETPPAATSGITTCKATSETSVLLKWEKVKNAKTYEIEYATKKKYFNGSDQVQKIPGIETIRYEKTGLESGQEYFFRIRSVNDKGQSAWSSVVSIIIGKKPSAPTTWSSTTTAITGESLNLYWVHNSEDGSSQTYAELELYIDGEKETHTIKNSTDEDEKDKTSVYPINTKEYAEGTTIQWRVRTAGITNKYGDWSVQRSIDIYAPAKLELNVTDVDGNSFDELLSLPFYVSALSEPNTQAPVGYYLTVTANESYETVDNIGNVKMVNKGEHVYSKHFDTSGSLSEELSANSLTLENNISYTVSCMVTMNSGLTAESHSEFTVSWTEEEYWPNAEIGIDEETLTAHICPFCDDTNVTLALYRREFDGSFVEIASDIEGGGYTFVTDPHPALDYARYRVVAKSIDTGAVSYYDIPGYPIGEKSVVIQWDEDWSYFYTSEEAELEQPPWSGSMLKLPYNVDISDKYDPEASLISYAGRENPVSYYGTQKGHTSTWKVEIPADDVETLYTLRRLAKWSGDVYVREPSGSGYWANVTVSFSQTHRDVTIPVSFNVTRVEGGM